MLKFAIHLAKLAGDQIADLSREQIQVSHKGRIDLVTNMDLKSQEILIKEIEKTYPDHGIIAEEGVEQKKESPFEWIIDPIDGTTNYIHKIPFFCVSIALMKEGEPYIGVCYNPANKDLFYAHIGQGAYLNDKKIHVSPTRNMIDALVATGFPYNHKNLNILISRFSRVIKKVQGIRRLGSAALDLCYVAAGSFDAFWEQGLKPWDMAAGITILLEAGGMATSIHGGPFDLFSGNVLVSNSLLHDELLSCM